MLNLEGDHLILWLLVRLHLLRLIGLNLSDVTLEPLVSLLIYPRLIFPEFWPTIWILQIVFSASGVIDVSKFIRVRLVCSAKEIWAP